MDERYTSINDNIFRLIESRDISQRRLAEMTGISKSAISDWKNKGHKPSASNVKKICEALNVTPEIIIGKTDLRPVERYTITKDDDLFDFIEVYNASTSDMKKRLLAYAIAMFKCDENGK